MTKFAAWCDAHQLMPTMENADKFAEEQRGTVIVMTPAEQAWIEAILRDARIYGRKVLALTLQGDPDHKGVLVRTVGEWSRGISFAEIGNYIRREALMLKAGL